MKDNTQLNPEKPEDDRLDLEKRLLLIEKELEKIDREPDDKYVRRRWFKAEFK